MVTTKQQSRLASCLFYYSEYMIFTFCPMRMILVLFDTRNLATFQKIFRYLYWPTVVELVTT